LYPTVEGFPCAASAGETAIGQEINLGTGETINIGELARRIFAQLGKTPKSPLTNSACAQRRVKCYGSTRRTNWRANSSVGSQASLWMKDCGAPLIGSPLISACAAPINMQSDRS
jgi:hypothetical protein